MAGIHRGSHRAPSESRSSGTRRRTLVAAASVALVMAGTYTAFRTLDDDEPTATPASTPSPSPSISSAPPSEPAATVTPSARPTSRALPRVSPDVPRRLTSGELLDAGFDDSVEPEGDLFTARSTGEVARWGSRGEPGSPGTDTVYVVGRVNADGDSAFGVLAQLKRRTKLSVRTDEGLLTYTVGTTASLPTQGLRRNPVITQKVPGRLVLVGIRYDQSGERLGYLLVTAKLTGAKRS